MAPPPRTQQQRTQDALDRHEHDTDAWATTADGGSAAPYLAPLSFLWDGIAVLVATPSSSPTGRHLQATGTVRCGVGPTRDLVLTSATDEHGRRAEISPTPEGRSSRTAQRDDAHNGVDSIRNHAYTVINRLVDQAGG